MKKIICFSVLCFMGGCANRWETAEFPLTSIQIQDRNGLIETISAPDRLAPYRDVDFFASQPFRKVIRVFKDRSKMRGKITTYHPNGQIYQYLESQDMRAFGTYREWHPNGALRIEATVIGGSADVAAGAQKDWVFDGIARVWDEHGVLLAQIPYEKGVIEGSSYVFDSSGQLQSQSPYTKGSMEGEYIEYYPRGATGEKIRSRTTYHRGVKNGDSYGFWENGSYSWVEKYQNGPLLEGKYYTDQGELISGIDGGFGLQALFKNSHLEQLVEHRRGQPEGVVKYFLPTGELLSVYHIKHGRKQGEEIQYFSSQERGDDTSKEPLPKLSIPWDSDRISGTVKTWYNNGKLESQRELARNKKNGSALGWYRDGSLMYMEEYEEDVLTKGQYFKKNQKEPLSSIANGNGTATLFDEQGVFLRKVQYVKGKPVDPE
jgi:antitoxin component YwqK of YwqJK toxin-antitoxin module